MKSRHSRKCWPARFPNNAILSHDLIEGAYARAGLVSDIEVVDDYPSHFSAFSRRKHRWVRGDWQIIFWLLPRVPDNAGHLSRNPLSSISRWKIVDNLRRSSDGIRDFCAAALRLAVLAGARGVLDAGGAGDHFASDLFPICVFNCNGGPRAAGEGILEGLAARFCECACEAFYPADILVPSDAGDAGCGGAYDGAHAADAAKNARVGNGGGIGNEFAKLSRWWIRISIGPCFLRSRSGRWWR